MHNTVTREDAEIVLRLVEQKFASYLKTWPVVDGHIDFDTLVDVDEMDRPRIVEWETDQAGTQLAIVWESGAPADWAYSDLGDVYVDAELAAYMTEFPGMTAADVSTMGVQGMPAGVCAEPYFSFVLVLYPTEG